MPRKERERRYISEYMLQEVDMSYACPYPEELLEKWDGVSNPMGSECHGCENYDCEHNLNPNPEEPYCDPYEVANAKERA